MNFITKHPVKIIWIVSIICFVILSGTGYYWYNYQLEPNDRPGFVGGVFGSVLGLFGTFIVLWSTTLQTRSIQREAAAEMKEQRKREDKLYRVQKLEVISSYVVKYQYALLQYGKGNKYHDQAFNEAILLQYYMRKKINTNDMGGSSLLEKVEEVNKKLLEFELINGVTLREYSDEIENAFNDLVDKYKHQD